jgi:hypothetical protein
MSPPQRASSSIASFRRTIRRRVHRRRSKGRRCGSWPSLRLTGKVTVRLSRQGVGEGDGRAGAHVIVASEPTTFQADQWTLLDKNHSTPFACGYLELIAMRSDHGRSRPQHQSRTHRALIRCRTSRTTPTAVNTSYHTTKMLLGEREVRVTSLTDTRDNATSAY